MHLERVEPIEPEQPSPFVNWTDLFKADFSNMHWLPGRLMTHGQQIALVGDGKAGKSLFCQEWAWRMAAGLPFLGDRSHDPVRVLYIDAENGHADLQGRFISFGATDQTMTNLAYASFPVLHPLDTIIGGEQLVQLVEASDAQIVFIDTVSRFIKGAENDSDTWLSLYRNTMKRLKAMGVASVRLDHFGKDKERGSRGSSAKTQDVDHVWELTGPQGGPLTLKRTHTRTGLGDSEYLIRRLGEKQRGRWVPGKTRHVPAITTDMPAAVGSVEWLIERLDEAGVPSDYGARNLRKAITDLGYTAAKTKIEEVARRRKGRLDNVPAHVPYSQVTLPSRPPRGHDQETAGQTSPGDIAGTHGDTPQECVPSPLPLRRGDVSGAGVEWTTCEGCHGPMENLHDGRTTHPTCGP